MNQNLHKVPSTIMADFCAALAHTLIRYTSPGPIEELGGHVALEGVIWHCVLPLTTIHEFVVAHETGIIDSSIELVLYRADKSCQVTLSVDDIKAILFVCEKIIAGAESVILTGDLLVSEPA